ncbi:MAG: alpha/beta hydrolase [bacterium]
MSSVGLSAMGGVSLRSETRRTPFSRAETQSSSFADARDGTRIFYKDSGAGRPFVFVAPWGLNSNWWEYQVAALAGPQVRCIAVDRRGHGRSDEPGRGYDFDTLADDLAAVIEKLGLRDVTLVGHSMGCADIARYVSRHGTKRVARIVLVSTITPLIARTPENPDGVDPALLEAGRARFRQDRPGQIANGAAGFFGAPKIPVSQHVMDWWTRMMTDHCSLLPLLQLHKAFTETDFGPDLRRINVPTLLIHGGSDTSARIKLTAERSVPLIAGSRLEVYADAAHGLPYTHMDKLNADLLAFAGLKQ